MLGHSALSEYPLSSAAVHVFSAAGSATVGIAASGTGQVTLVAMGDAVVGVSASATAYHLYGIGDAAIGLSASASGTHATVVATGAAAITILPAATGYIRVTGTSAVSIGIVTDAAAYWFAPPVRAGLACMRYYGILTGAADSEADYTLPLKTLQLIKRSGTNSYYTISIPYSLEAIEAFEARPAGDILLMTYPEYLDGSTGEHEVFEQFNIDSIQPSRGASSASLVVTGYRQETIPAALTVQLDDSMVVSLRGTAMGDRVFDLVPALSGIRPSSVLQYAGDNYAVKDTRIGVSDRYFSLSATCELSA